MGVAGQEGLQAVNSSDYAIAQVRSAFFSFEGVELMDGTSSGF